MIFAAISLTGACFPFPRLRVRDRRGRFSGRKILPRVPKPMLMSVRLGATSPRAHTKTTGIVSSGRDCARAGIRQSASEPCNTAISGQSYYRAQSDLRADESGMNGNLCPRRHRSLAHTPDPDETWGRPAGDTEKRI